jgi:hypothetical protein
LNFDLIVISTQKFDLNFDLMTNLKFERVYMLASMELGVKSVTWDMVKTEVNRYPNYQLLALWIICRCQGPLTSMPATLHPYWRVRHSLRVLDGVPMLEDRTVIPVSLDKYWRHCTLLTRV